MKTSTILKFHKPDPVTKMARIFYEIIICVLFASCAVQR